ncbi:MAG: YicC/YloC family endoribonuclease [Candidatus Marinimicrobia bacterium]|nr:YicC/YloC family endoribonuclease [Candidatus Neomarinimicrobiota bacterium]
MTGFGRYEGEFKGKKFHVEIHSVNSRYFNIYFNITNELNFLQEQLNNLLKNKISRGKISYKIIFSDTDDSIINKKINKGILKNYINELLSIKDEFNLDNDLKISDLIQLPDIFTTNSEELINSKLAKEILTCTEGALNNLIEMQVKEGEHIKRSFIKILKNIEQENLSIRKLQKKNISEHFNKLKDRVTKLLNTKKIEAGLIEQEIVLLADKLDISEENERLSSHINQFNNYLEYDENVGKRLIFLLQEMLREITTIGNKANSSKISQKVVELKNQIEILREQCQNIQ